MGGDRPVRRRSSSSYELFDLWALPAATAWLVIGYFAAALLVDTLFSGAAFCKHVCPVGQFNFRGLDALAAGGRSRATGRLPDLHDGGLHQGTTGGPPSPVDRPARLRAGALPAD